MTDLVKCPHCDVHIMVTKSYKRNFEAILDNARQEHPEIMNPILERLDL